MVNDYPEPLMVLEGMVTAVHNHVQSGDSVVSSDDLLAWLRPFCSDGSLAVRPRIEVLQILENNFSLRDSDVHLLLLYRTRAVLKDLQVKLARGLSPTTSWSIQRRLIFRPIDWFSHI
eukprot:XP_014040205.1 PREDICTED: neuroblastoma-amplified sequence-like [Salmo salar]